MPLSADGDDFIPNHQLYEDKKPDQLADGEMVTTAGAVPSCIVVPTNFEPELVFQTTIALHMPELLPLVTNPDNNHHPRVIRTFDETYEVASLHPADEALVDVYAGITKHDATLRPVGPVGAAHFVPAIIEDSWDNHPTLAEGRDTNHQGADLRVLLDHAVLDTLRVGMKLRATMCVLALGPSQTTLTFVKEVSEVVVAWHVFLPQQLMRHYKAPRPDTRLPPSAADPDVEARRVAAIAEEEEREEVKEMRKVDPELDREVRELEDAETLRELMGRAEI